MMQPESRSERKEARTFAGPDLVQIRTVRKGGHLCEGANLVQSGREFCLWTRCGKHDVPANAAHEGRYREVTCVECLKADMDTAGDELPDCVWRNAETPFADNH